MNNKVWEDIDSILDSYWNNIYIPYKSKFAEIRHDEEKAKKFNEQYIEGLRKFCKEEAPSETLLNSFVKLTITNKFPIIQDLTEKQVKDAKNDYVEIIEHLAPMGIPIEDDKINFNYDDFKDGMYSSTIKFVYPTYYLPNGQYNPGYESWGMRYEALSSFSTIEKDIPNHVAAAPFQNVELALNFLKYAIENERAFYQDSKLYICNRFPMQYGYQLGRTIEYFEEREQEIFDFSEFLQIQLNDENEKVVLQKVKEICKVSRENEQKIRDKISKKIEETDNKTVKNRWNARLKDLTIGIADQIVLIGKDGMRIRL